MPTKTVYDFSTGRYGVVENGSGPGHRAPSVAAALLAGSREEEQELRRGLAVNAFEVYYQPVIDVRRGDLVGAEALLRWQHDAELVPAESFIRTAERSGVVLRLGTRVLRAATMLRAGCGLPLDRGPHISVNLSRDELLQPDLIANVQAALRDVALAPELLAIEVSEHTLAGAPQEITAAMRALWEIGVPCTLDDLGSGALDPAMLASLPLVSAKVDLPTALRTDATLGACMRTIDQAQALGIVVIAKRVEGFDELELMSWLELGFAQGFAFGKPAPEAVFRELVASTSPGRHANGNGNGHSNGNGSNGNGSNGNGHTPANGRNGNSEALRSPGARARRPARARRNGASS
ncbi:MAG: EAL domain-containing protein [Chloroflexi bacterium]|nr:EAL domain-containing protein [Chloroflexota bacterium]